MISVTVVLVASVVSVDRVVSESAKAPVIPTGTSYRYHDRKLGSYNVPYALYLVSALWSQAYQGIIHVIDACTRIRRVATSTRTVP